MRIPCLGHVLEMYAERHNPHTASAGGSGKGLGAHRARNSSQLVPGAVGPGRCAVSTSDRLDRPSWDGVSGAAIADFTDDAGGRSRFREVCARCAPLVGSGLPQVEVVRGGSLKDASIARAQCSMLSAQCSVLSAQCSVLSAQCSILNAQCSMLRAQRSVLKARCSMLRARS